MRTIVLFFFMLLFFVVPGAAQETCRLELKDAPSFFNLKLGMTDEQVRDQFGKKLKFKPKKKTEERTFFQNFIAHSPPAALTGVRALYLRFLNRKIYQIEIFYENRAEWQTLAGFTSSLATTQNFANALWTTVADKAEVKCVDFTLLADNVLNPRIELTDDAARTKALKARQKQR